MAGALHVIAAMMKDQPRANAAAGVIAALAGRAEAGLNGARRSISPGLGKGDAGVAQLEALGDVLLSWERWPSG